MVESVEQIGFALISNELAVQERALSGLRTCAGTLLASASIAGSLLAVGARHGSLDVWGILAVITFALCSVSAIWVLLPHGFVFALGGEALVVADAHGRLRDTAEAYRAATAWSVGHASINSIKIARLSGWLAASGVLLSVEIVLWAISAIG